MDAGGSGGVVVVDDADDDDDDDDDGVDCTVDTDDDSDGAVAVDVRDDGGVPVGTDGAGAAFQGGFPGWEDRDSRIFDIGCLIFFSIICSLVAKSEGWVLICMVVTTGAEASE